MNFRIEKDSLGEIKVPAKKYWGAQTERSRNNFKIGPVGSMPTEIIHALALTKKAAAYANFKLGILSAKKNELISEVCDEIIQGKHDTEFPLVIWQTGSGTQTNMNCNEVIANRAHVINGGSLNDIEKIIHPNDDVNLSQSSNDVFPTAMHIATFKMVIEITLNGLQILQHELQKKVIEFESIIKIGRTHFMDAIPLTLGQEFSGYSTQIEKSIRTINNALFSIRELAVGGTAVGTGLNAPMGYDKVVVKKIAELTGFPFIPAVNKFEAIATNDAMVEMSCALKRTAVSLMKIANDIRMLSSGPRSGLSELLIPNNEPGSSMMPGKVNPTQIEALTMVCAQVIGNDVTVSIAGSNGHFELNVFKPVIGSNVLQSARLIGEACISFSEKCVKDIRPNLPVIKRNVDNSLMLVTALNTKIGYNKSAEIANYAFENGTTLKQAALHLKHVTSEEFDLLVDPSNMV
jgi:fumarate hydratase class II